MGGQQIEEHKTEESTEDSSDSSDSSTCAECDCNEDNCDCDSGSDNDNNSDSDNDNNSDSDSDSKNLVKMVSVPSENCRTDYVPRTDRYNNIFLKDSLVVADDIEVDNEDIENLLNNKDFLKLDSIIPNERTTRRSHLDFYGKAANFSRQLIENSNGFIMLGTSGDEGSTNHIDALLDKSKAHMPLYLNEMYFIFKNRMYNNLLTCNLTDYTEDVQILNNGKVGWGGTFYAFDVILEPHPTVLLERDIIIRSPLQKTVGHNHVLKCCGND